MSDVKQRESMLLYCYQTLMLSVSYLFSSISVERETQPFTTSLSWVTKHVDERETSCVALVPALISTRRAAALQPRDPQTMWVVESSTDRYVPDSNEWFAAHAARTASLPPFVRSMIISTQEELSLILHLSALPYLRTMNSRNNAK